MAGQGGGIITEKEKKPGFCSGCKSRAIFECMPETGFAKERKILQLWQRFNQKDPVKQGWYYGSLANLFGEDETIRETREYREYAALCRDLFSGSYDGDGNRMEEDDEDEDREEDEMIPARCFFADVMDEIYAGLPEGTKAWAAGRWRTLMAAGI